jgi:hypothetical protein
MCGLESRLNCDPTLRARDSFFFGLRGIARGGEATDTAASRETVPKYSLGKKGPYGPYDSGERSSPPPALQLQLVESTRDRIGIGYVCRFESVKGRAVEASPKPR